MNKRIFLGIDWAEAEHMVWAGDDTGAEVGSFRVEETAEGMARFERWLEEQRAAGVELVAGIERPDGRMVEFLLDHGVVVYALNPKAVDRARDRYRASHSKSDWFDGVVISHFVRTDHPRLQPLRPNTAEAEELKLLTRDYDGLVHQQTRLINQLTRTLKEYYPLALELFTDLTTKTARDFLLRFPEPVKARKMRRHSWDAFVREHSMAKKHAAARWETIKRKQIPVPDHVRRTKARRMRALILELTPVINAVAEYKEEIERFFAQMPAAQWSETLPAGARGVLAATIFAEMGDAPGRWISAAHFQAQAGVAPVTRSSGKGPTTISFRHACNKHLRCALTQYAFVSLRHCEWANAYYRRQRARGHNHQRALRALGNKWAKIFFIMWLRRTPYDETHHLATMARQHLRQAAA